MVNCLIVEYVDGFLNWRQHPSNHCRRSCSVSIRATIAEEVAVATGGAVEAVSTWLTFRIGVGIRATVATRGAVEAVSNWLMGVKLGDMVSRN
jgi:hypothetical protein